MVQWLAKLIRFGDDRTAGGHIGKCLNGGKQAGEPAVRAGGGNLADVLKGRVGVGFSGAGEANCVLKNDTLSP